MDRCKSDLKALPRFSGLDKTEASVAMCENCMSQGNMKISPKDYPSCKRLSNGIVDVMAIAEKLGDEEASRVSTDLALPM